MKRNLKIQPWLVGGLIVAALLTLLISHFSGSPVSAHGKELNLEVSSLTPDPKQPLVRLYYVTVLYAADREPVSGAQVLFTAERRGGGLPLEPVSFTPINQPGTYAAQVTYPMYGSWSLTLSVEDFGQGEVTFLEELVPAGPNRDSEETRQQVLELFFGFDWRDVAAIAVRISHTLASFIWFGLTGVILVAYAFLPPLFRPAIFRRISPIFLPAASLSLMALLFSGIYTAAFGAPIRPPGVFDFAVIWSIPFGIQYSAVIAYKLLALGVCGWLAVRMAKALKLASMPVVAGGITAVPTGRPAGVSEGVAVQQSSLLRLAVVNAVIGLTLIVAIVLAIYLHNISHLAVFLPE